MIAHISEYVKTIATFLVFITLIGIIVPSGKYKKYMDLILGLVLICIVLLPLTNFISNNEQPFGINIPQMMFELNKNEIYSQNDYYENMKNEIVLETYKNGIMEHIKIVVENNSNLRLINTHIDIEETEENYGEIKSLTLYVNEEDRKKSKEPLIKVAPIKVSAKKEEKKDIEDNEEIIEIKNIRNLISDFYNLSVDNIYITVQKTKELD